MKEDNNNNKKRDNEKIRKYRRLRRKAKRLKKERGIVKFIFNKVSLFTIVRFFLEKIKFSWITFGIFFLAFFFNFLNDYNTKQFTKYREYKTQLRETKKELNKCKSLTENQQLLITDLQKEVFNWSKKYDKLIDDGEEKLKKIIQQSQKDQDKIIV